MKKKPKVFYIIIILLVLCSCRKTISNSIVEEYLKEKYEKEFTYVSEGNDASLSNTWSKIYEDIDGNQFNIRYLKNDHSFIQDNYYSVIYDGKITTLFQNGFSSDYKIYATSSETYTSKVKINNINDYLKEDSNISLKIYTTENNYDVDTIKQKTTYNISNNNINSYISVTIYKISKDDFEFYDKLTNANIAYLDSESFTYNN